jgi:Arc/MetJ family transcription regulator
MPVAVVDLEDGREHIGLMKSTLKRKNVYLDEGKIRRAQRILGTQTEAETIDRALDLVVFRKEILRSLEPTAGRGWGGKNAEDGKTSH